MNEQGMVEREHHTNNATCDNENYTKSVERHRQRMKKQ